MAGLKVRKVHAAGLLGIGLLGLAAYDAGCSVPNRTFYNDQATGGDNGDNGTAGKPAGGSNSSGSSGVGQAGAAGEAGQNTNTGGSAPVVMRAVLAVAGTDPSSPGGNVVSLIDPKSGTELARQTITGAAVVGLAYDGASNKDVWYEFTGASFPADSASKSALQVYSFDDTRSSWKAVSSTAVPGLPPPRPHSFVVLNDRLSYLSYDIVSGKAVDSLTVLDTTDPKAVKQIKVTGIDFGSGSEVLGMVGTRGVLGDESAPGGTLAVLVGATCTGEHAQRVCGKVQLLPVTVGADVSQGVAVDFSPALIGEPALVSAQATQLAYIAFTAAPTKSVTLKSFDPRKLGTINTGTAAFAAHWLGGLAYAECKGQDAALLTAVDDGKLYAASGEGFTDDTDLGHQGQSVVYDPFSARVFTLFNTNNSEFADAAPAVADGGAAAAAPLSAFDITQDTMHIALSPAPAASWKPSANLQPNIAVARFPAAYACK